MPAAKTNKSARAFAMTLPATSANLGPAFDAAALALRIHLRVRARSSPDFSVIAGGCDTEICGRLHDHLILNTYREVLQAEGKPVLPLALRLDNRIPIGKGCGSSAAARLAGIALAVYFGKLRWSDARIIAEASRREHHPDNAAACWMGGLAIAKMTDDSATQVVKFMPKGRWPLLLVVPEKPLSTEEARRVLPAQYSRVDVVRNLQNALMLLAAFVEGRPDLLAAALDDRIHQPYRAPLCPLLPALQELAGTAGILGAVLSGAGPSVLMFLNANAPVTQVQSRVKRHLRAHDLAGELIVTSIDLLGAGKDLHRM